MDSNTPCFPVHHQLPELAQIHVHQIGDAIHDLKYRVGQMQMICHFIYGTRAFVDFGVRGSPSPLGS